MVARWWKGQQRFNGVQLTPALLPGVQQLLVVVRRNYLWKHQRELLGGQLMRQRPILLGAAALSAAIFGAVGISGMVSASDKGNGAEVVSVLAAPSTKADILPAGVDPSALGDGGLKELRYLGDDGKARYWVAIDGGKNLCLVAISPSLVAAAACHTPEAVEADGLMVGLDGNEKTDGNLHVIGFLLPDSAPATSEKGWTSLSSNLMTSDQTVTTGQRHLVPREKGSTAAPIVIFN